MNAPSLSLDAVTKISSASNTGKNTALKLLHLAFARRRTPLGLIAAVFKQKETVLVKARIYACAEEVARQDAAKAAAETATQATTQAEEEPDEEEGE